MEHFILQFFTGTMAFRSPQPWFITSGAEYPDAFLETWWLKTNQNAGKAAKNAAHARDMQGACARKKWNNARRAKQKYAGENGSGEGTQKIRQGNR